MPLSEHEQRLLDQLEKQLNAEDPTFVHSMSSQKAPKTQASMGARNIVIGVLIFLIGLGVILAGVTMKLTVVGVIGFLLAVGGIYLAAMPQKRSSSSSDFSVPKTVKAQSSFMQNLEAKWEERKYGGH